MRRECKYPWVAYDMIRDKIHGVFETEEEARECADEIRYGSVFDQSNTYYKRSIEWMLSKPINDHIKRLSS